MKTLHPYHTYMKFFTETGKKADIYFEKCKILMDTDIFETIDKAFFGEWADSEMIEIYCFMHFERYKKPFEVKT